MSILLLDLMDTLIVDPFFIFVKNLPNGIKEFKSLVNINAYLDFELGLLSPDEYLEKFFYSAADEIKASFSAKDFKSAILKTPIYKPGVKDFLEKYSNKIDMFLASNYSIWVDIHIKNLDLHKHLKGKFVSCNLGCRKPDAEYFSCILDNLKKIYKPNEINKIIFIDDRKKNILSAQSANINSINANGNWINQVIERFNL